ncbi:MAG: hypothetical protein M3R14_07045 [Acidobacteriota bacterium]|nr:hypothetical protein [Acidobacteriota bacterium]
MLTIDFAWEVIGCEGAGSDLHSALSVKFWQAWWRFRPMSTPPYGTSTRN